MPAAAPPPAPARAGSAGQLGRLGARCVPAPARPAPPAAPAPASRNPFQHSPRPRQRPGGGLLVVLRLPLAVGDRDLAVAQPRPAPAPGPSRRCRSAASPGGQIARLADQPPRARRRCSLANGRPPLQRRPARRGQLSLAREGLAGQPRLDPDPLCLAGQRGHDQPIVSPRCSRRAKYSSETVHWMRSRIFSFGSTLPTATGSVCTRRAATSRSPHIRYPARVAV